MNEQSASITIAQVIAHMREQAQPHRFEVQTASLLQDNRTTLPADLSMRSVMALLANQQAMPSPMFLANFRNSAIFLAMGHEVRMHLTFACPRPAWERQGRVRGH